MAPVTTAPDWTALTAFARAMADEAGKAILPYFRNVEKIEAKPGYGWDPVTEADRAAERVMRAMIEQRFPDHGILGEEYGHKEARSEYTWILDPVDGTRAFICGMTTWTTLIGLSQEGVPKLGMMNQPYVGECFFGNPDGAWSEHRGERQRIRCKPQRALSECIFCTTAPELYRNDAEKSILKALSAKTRLTRYGGDAYFFSLVAAGQIDIAMDAHMQPYDIAPLIPIIEGAGGHVATWEGGPAAAGGNVAAVSNEALMATLREVIDEAVAAS